MRYKHIYQAIKEENEKHGYPISTLCKLGNVSRAAYYKWLHRKVTLHCKPNAKINRCRCLSDSAFLIAYGNRFAV